MATQNTCHMTQATQQHTTTACCMLFAVTCVAFGVCIVACVV